jgi:hypothetical protein
MPDAYGPPDGDVTPIFLVSLPRSGSTFCQRVLASHDQIATSNEPTFLLPFLYADKDADVRSTYNHHYTSWAVQDFAAGLPNGDDYRAALRSFALDLYRRSMGDSVAPYYLDKTPKYHFVFDDLLQVFPDAKFIVLWRNPLAVIASILHTWGGDRWNVFEFDIDLHRGVERLVDTYVANADRVVAIQYEEAVGDPITTWRRVFDHLDLDFDESLLDRFSDVKLEGRVTDPNSRRDDYQVVRTDSLDRWRDQLQNPLRKAWCRRYLTSVGRERLAVMGYDLDDLLGALDDAPSSWSHLADDLYRMPLGAAHRVLEPRLLRDKLRTWRAGERVYMHN